MTIKQGQTKVRPRKFGHKELFLSDRPRITTRKKSGPILGQLQAVAAEWRVLEPVAYEMPELVARQANVAVPRNV
jgi:hypothetical protein